MRTKIDSSGKNRWCFRTWRVMKITALLLTLALVQVSAKSISQRITFSGKNVTLEKVFATIKQQTGYAFFYNYRLLDGTKSVSLNLKNASLEEVLRSCFKDQPVTYTIEDKTIVITPLAESAASPVVVIKTPDRVVTGKITSAEDGHALQGATVTVQGTQVSAQTDADGKFMINVPSANSALEVSFVGFNKQTVTLGAANVLNIALTVSSTELEEIVVNAALGVTRKERSLGYAAQQLKGDDLTTTKQQDLGTSLAGKIAGVQVLGGSGAKFGTSEIRLRGVNGIGGGDNPLFVVDGVVVSSTAVNMDDVESLTVLKGPAATSLYGQRGSEGVIVITTKKGGNRGIGIDFNHSTTFESVALLPKQQNEYGGGGTQTWSIFKYNPAIDAPALAAMDGAKYYDYSYDESWGPRMDGTLYAPWYAWNKFDPDYAKLKPFNPQPNNVRSFYQTGVEVNSNIAFSKAADNYNMRVSYTNINRTGVSPNTRMDRNMLSFKGMFTPIPKLTIMANFNFNTSNYFNRPKEGYAQNTASSFNQFFHRDIEMDKLRNYKNPDGTFTSWNITDPRNTAPKYTDNPYTEIYENLRNSANTNAYGNLGASYKISPAVQLNFTARGVYANNYDDSRVASGTMQVESFSTSQSRSRENNYVGNVDFNKKFSDFSLKAAAYAELRINHSDNMRETTAGGFTVPNFFNIAASKDRPNVTNSTSNKKVQSLYAYTSWGFRNMLFLDVNIRNDWSSSLPENANSYLYGGVSTSFIFTELLKQRNVFSYGKVFASVGRVGSDIDPYSIHQVYSSAGLYGSTPGMTVPDQIPNETLKPALSTSYEAGVDLRFLRDRIRFSFNYYDRKTTNQIISLTIPATTGFTSALVNAGEIGNHGFEFMLGGTPISKKTFTWDMALNLAINRNKIFSLYPGVTNFQYQSFGWGTPFTANREVGKPFGTIIVNGPKRDAGGNVLVDDKGYPIIETGHNMGSYMPDFTGGFTTSLKYKSFILGFSLDFQAGGKFVSITQENLHMAGLGTETVGNNDRGKPMRDPVASGGGTLVHGVRASDGKPNTTYIDTQDFWESSVNYVWEYYVYKTTYVKMREISLGYQLPAGFISKIGAQRGSVSLIARNPFLIYTGIPGIDPSESAGAWMEGGQLPGTRSLGINLKLTF